MINEISINNRYELLIDECLRDKRKAIDSLNKMFDDENIDFLWQIAYRASMNNNLNPSQQRLPNLNYVREFMTHEKMLKQIDTQYWSRLFKETSILNYVSSSIREKWNDQIYQCEVPEFNIDAVRPTVMGLIKDLPELFAQRLRDAHDVLSRSHKTNKVQRFGKKMIFTVFYNTYSWVERNVGAINDIRSTISQLMGGDQFNYWDTKQVLRQLNDKGIYGEWVRLNEYIAVKIFMKGTCHLEIHPLICDQLNILLSDNTIPDLSSEWYVKEQRKRKTEFHDLTSIVVSKELMGAIEKDHPNNDPFWSYIEHGTYNHKPVLDYVKRVGLLPEYKSHQFYPTPQVIVDEVMKYIPVGIKTILEPSAGTGRLINGLKDYNVTAIDIAPLHCEILDAKEFTRVFNMDFMQYDTENKFDLILMNPPFSKGRSKSHIDKAREHLNAGGTILAILPKGSITKDMEVLKHFNGVFENTSIDTYLVRIENE